MSVQLKTDQNDRLEMIAFLEGFVFANRMENPPTIGNQAAAAYAADLADFIATAKFIDAETLLWILEKSISVPAQQLGAEFSNRFKKDKA